MNDIYLFMDSTKLKYNKYYYQYTLINKINIKYNNKDKDIKNMSNNYFKYK
jgi:hypothetical protein